jgi:predicted DNA-binding transcriptional regulator YafY
MPESDRNHYDPFDMSGTTSRALRLLSLLQSRRVWTGAELIERLGVSERTLRRDIDRLRDLGYEVDSVTGPAGGYQLQPGADIPPLLLDDEEATAIAVGLMTAAGGSIEGLEETSLRALTKLEQVLPPRIRKQVETLQAAVVPLIRAWVTVDAGVLTNVAQACRDNERIRFEYQTRDGERAERHVEPHQLVSIHQRWYLLAFDRDREDWRTFRLDRMSSPWGTRIRFDPRAIPGGSAASFVEDSLRSAPTRYRAEATVYAPADDVADRLKHGGAEVEPIDEERCLVRIGGDSLEWLAFTLIWQGFEFEVHQPAELVDFVADLSARLARAAAR